MSEDWIEAARVLGKNPSAQLPCPKCGLAFLQVQDVPLPNEHIDRWLKCPKCDAYGKIYMKIKRDYREHRRVKFMRRTLVQPEYRKVRETLAPIFGSRVNRLFSPENVAHTMHVVRMAFRSKLKATEAKELGFHMADWGADAAFIVALHLFPKRFTAKEIRDATFSLALHLGYHLKGVIKALDLEDTVARPIQTNVK